MTVLYVMCKYSGNIYYSTCYVRLTDRQMVLVGCEGLGGDKCCWQLSLAHLVSTRRATFARREESSPVMHLLQLAMFKLVYR